MRQLTTAMRARNFASLSAVSSLASSARQTDFMSLWHLVAGVGGEDVLSQSASVVS
jgi:purine nucleoside permease